MKKALSSVILLGMISFLTGCMQFAIEGDCPKTPDSVFEKETVHGSFYGFNWDDKTRNVRKSSDRLGIAKVEYHTNVFYSIVSLMSLGLYVPVDIDYWIEGPAIIERMPKKKNKDN